MVTRTAQWVDLPPTLRKAYRWILAVLVFCLLGAAGLLVDHLTRNAAAVDVARFWMQRLDLSMPAFWPAGTLLRVPESTSPAVVPCLEPWDMDLQGADLVAAARLWRLREKEAP
jgi:hypothetical protein